MMVCIKHVVCVHVTCLKSQMTSVWMHMFLQALCVCGHVLLTLWGQQFIQSHCGDAKALRGQDVSPHNMNHYI